MADRDIIHTAEIIKAAIPYVDTKTKGLAELFTKLIDLLGSLKSAGNSDNVAATGLQGTKIDVEGLLKGIRPILDIKEQEIVDRILNIFNMKRMFEMYNNMMSAMKTMQEFGGFNFNDSTTDADNVTNNFTGSNFESIFQGAGFGTSDNNTAFNNSSDADNRSNFNNSSAFNNNSSSDNSSAFNNSSASDNNNAFNNSSTSNTSKDTTTNSGNNSNGMNNKMMFEMLKTMVPPEQMSTFENLSMLLNTMSYDNNSKPDNSKEQNND